MKKIDSTWEALAGSWPDREVGKPGGSRFGPMDSKRLRYDCDFARGGMDGAAIVVVGDAGTV